MDFADGIRKAILSDGRALSYNVYGLNSPSDMVIWNVFYFHGFPASRLEAALWHSEALSQKIRIIAPDRPGMGHSSMQQGRKISDWPKDVVELADHLRIQEFSVLGISGGCPYALACAHDIPNDRLKSIAICSGAYPTSFGTQGMMFGARLLLNVASWSPSLVAFAMDQGIGKSSRNQEHPEIFEQKIMKEMESRPSPDKACLEDQSFKELFLDSVKAAFRVSAEGVAWDAKLLATPWGFELESIQRDKIILWHGKEDVNSPFPMAQKAQTLLKNAKLIGFDNEGHVSVPVRYAQSLAVGQSSLLTIPRYGRKILEGLMV